jgi:hypothetical protein
MKEPAPTRRTRTWTGRSQPQRSASLPANRMIQLAQAVNRATAVEKAQSQGIESAVPVAADLSSSTVMPPRLLPSPPMQPKATAADDTQAVKIAQQIEQQAARIEQLSTELRAAMAQLKMMTQPTLLESSAPLPQEGSDPIIQNHLNPEAAIATAQSIALPNHSETNLTQAKQNASSTAQLLRRLRHRQRPSDRLRPRRVEPTLTRAKARMRSPQIQMLRRYPGLRFVHRWIRTAVQLPIGLPALLSDAAVWVAIAAAARIGLQTLIQTYPVLWPLVMVFVPVAALLATYQAVFNAAVGSPWGYRLLLVVAGLWLGGKL